MKKYTLYIVAAFAVMLFASSCNLNFKGKEKQATVEGVIAEANGHLLVLEHISDGAPHFIDSLRLDSIGKFQFAPKVTEKGPDFFSLHLDNNQSIQIVIDSLGTAVSVKATAATMANEYEVGDAENQELKAAVLCGNRLRGQILALAQKVNSKAISDERGRDSLATLVANYKATVLKEFIYKNPASAASYYILQESVNGRLVFDAANNAADNRAFGAVATSWMNSYPNSPRTKVLERMTIEGQRIRRAINQQAAAQDSILQTKLVETGYPVLNLRNADDHEVSLSSLVDGKSVVLVDFNAYALNVSGAHNIVLGDIYEKYKDKGLKIYQVCLDFDENFWKTSADNLPWTTVRDEEVLFDLNGNIKYSPAAALYNVQNLPTTYIISKSGEVKVRIEDDSQLENEIKKILK